MTIDISNVKDIKKRIKKIYQLLDELDIKKSEIKKETKLEEIGITWKDDSVTTEKADSLSFDRRKVSIEYKDEITVIPLKNIKKLKFANSLLKMTYDWNWNFKTYDDSTSNDLTPTPIQLWYKYTPRTDSTAKLITY